MKLFLSMPGQSEFLIIIIFVIIFVLLIPILAIVFYSRSKELKKQIEQLTIEKNELLKKLLDKN